MKFALCILACIVAVILAQPLPTSPEAMEISKKHMAAVKASCQAKNETVVQSLFAFDWAKISLNDTMKYFGTYDYSIREAYFDSKGIGAMIDASRPGKKFHFYADLYKTVQSPTGWIIFNLT